MTITCDLCGKECIEGVTPQYGGRGDGGATGPKFGNYRHYDCHVERFGKPGAQSIADAFAAYGSVMARQIKELTARQPGPKLQARYDWIKARIAEEIGGHVDILNSDFVDDYIAKFDAGYRPVNWGAHHCPQLGRDLSAMYNLGMLKRSRIGLTDGAWQPGFPKWVYTYTVKG
jgi:hypothetical protein